MAGAQVLRLSKISAWLDQNRQLQQAMKAGHCVMAGAQVLRLSKISAWLDQNRQLQQAMKVGLCRMAGAHIRLPSNTSVNVAIAGSMKKKSGERCLI